MGTRARDSIPGFEKIPLGFEESHLYSGQLYDVIVGQPLCLRPDRLAVDQREVTFFAGLNMHDVITFSTASDCSDLHARATQSRESFGQLKFTTGKGATQDLQLGQW